MPDPPADEFPDSYAGTFEGIAGRWLGWGSEGDGVLAGLEGGEKTGVGLHGSGAETGERVGTTVWRRKGLPNSIRPS